MALRSRHLSCQPLRGLLEAVELDAPWRVIGGDEAPRPSRRRQPCRSSRDTPELIPGFFGHHTFPTVPVDKDRLAAHQHSFDGLAVQWIEATAHGWTATGLLKECSSVLYDARATGGLGALVAWP